MKNRIVGMLIIGIALLIGFIIYSFNSVLTTIVSTTCTHGSTCPMFGTIKLQTKISMGIMLFVGLLGVYLVFFGREERIITKIKTLRQQIAPSKITKESYQKVLLGLDNDEKLIFETVIEANGAIFQSDIVDKTRFTKVKVTRVLDKLEGMGLIERKRRGMTNIVILRHQSRPRN